MKITYYGHSCFLIELGGKKLLTDPFISPNELATNIKVDEIECDYILISHGHEDHIADLVQIANRNKATVVGIFEIVMWAQKQGVENIHPMNTGGKWHFDFGNVKLVKAVHSSSLPDGSYAGAPTGFVIWNTEQCLYFAGDTALTLDMKLLPQICPPLNVAILPVGDNFTMGYKDAVLASEFIHCNQIIGCHFDTFGYIKIDHQAATKYFAERQKKLHLLEVGETRNF